MTNPSGAPDNDVERFDTIIEPYRTELRLHCYRMLGSLQDAEDMTQVALLRAWQKLHTFEGRGPLRAWLYRIATNACLDMLDQRSRRTLPKLLLPDANPHESFVPSDPDRLWLDPFPDAWLPDVDHDPEARYRTRESIQMAFMAALHSLPSRQRAVLLLRDVLDWRAHEVAQLLETTVSAVNSALHRARTTLREKYHSDEVSQLQSGPIGEDTQELLSQYLVAWERADVSGLVALLREDAKFSMPPSPAWYRGRTSIEILFSNAIFAGEGTDRWRMRPTRANGQPAFGIYEWDSDSGSYRAFAVQVLSIEAGQIAEVITFVHPSLLPHFDLPTVLNVSQSVE